MNHIEIIAEKNTVAGIIEPIASEYCVPLTITRGQCSLPPRKGIADRFRLSGRSQLILLILGDYDPDGMSIVNSTPLSLRDDFGIDEDLIKPIHVALNKEQVATMDLPLATELKATSSNYEKFVKEYGDKGYELEAIPPVKLQELLREAIISVLDIDAFNHEVEIEKEDAVYLKAVREQLKKQFVDVPKPDEI